MKTKSKRMLVVLVLVVASFLGWTVVSFTTKGSRSATWEIFLFSHQGVEQVFSAASAAVDRLGYKTSDGTSSLCNDGTSNMSLMATNEDGLVVEICVYSKTDGQTDISIRLTEKRDDVGLREIIGLRAIMDGTALRHVWEDTAPLQVRVSRILKAIRASLESPSAHSAPHIGRVTPGLDEIQGAGEGQ